MKLLTVAIPCYNSQDYMEHAVETALVGGEDVEIILVNDGSSDKTAEIADRLQKEHPTIVRAIQDLIHHILMKTGTNTRNSNTFSPTHLNMAVIDKRISH